MRKIYALLIGLMASLADLSAIIIETAQFSEITRYLRPHTLIILDIDDTLLLPVQTLGTDVWFLYRLNTYKAQGMCSEDALDKALAEWEAVRHLTAVKIVEEGTERIIKDMQEQKVIIMGLTTQGLALATRTVRQLHSLGIDLCKTAPCSEDHYFLNGHGVLYREGLLFTSGTPKGPALLKFLDLIGYQPKCVVFINDKQTHLQDVEQALQNRGIEFIGLRYSYGDERVARFNKKIADIQWDSSSFSRILSDEEAEKILNLSS